MKLISAGLAALTLLMTTPVHAQTPVEVHGALSISGKHVVDAQGQMTALSGVSYFWSNTDFGQSGFYNPQSVAYFAKDWNVSVVRAAMGIDGPGGYAESPEANRVRVKTIVDAAIAQGIYVIIDWHSHHADKDPQAAVAFFSDMARTYGQTPNVIYEIYNEPLRDVSWPKTIRPYAETVIDAIRAMDPDNLILVGTPTWDQDVDLAAADPIKGRRNIAYTLHFYAGTHKDDIRAKARAAIAAEAPLFVSEWGSVNADGNGAAVPDETRKWFQFLKANCLSNANWAVSNKAEAASIFKPGVSPTGPWTDADLTPSGLLTRDLVRNWTADCR
ncbi:Endoglucanase Z [Asticcacaulis sp. MM231]|uniref:glycoside hydrolase family 5 protein n=1 Tax=Asticcacaulis sp. MM231 TaxID=3157666 RepID=UPI0032D583EC